MSAPRVIVSGPFDDFHWRELRFLEAASALGPLTVLLWSDEVVARHLGRPPRFPLAERTYVIRAVRYVNAVDPITELPNPNSLPESLVRKNDRWIDVNTNEARREFSNRIGIDYKVLNEAGLKVIPEEAPSSTNSGRKKVVVTGCYDWLHSGHVRFFEEVSALGDLYVVVGHDANIRLLKGDGHPHFTEAERRYVVGSIRHVTQALVSSGTGWLDAAPEIERLQPDIYAVNEDGDRGGKREFCQSRGIEYRVLQRLPAPGLPARSSTDLRGY